MGVEPEVLARTAEDHLAEQALAEPMLTSRDEGEVYGALADKAAALGLGIAGRRPFHRGNKAIAWMAAREFLARNGKAVRLDVAQHDDVVRVLGDPIDHQRLTELFQQGISQAEADHE